MTDPEKQVNIIGAGLAGLSAAITLAQKGISSRLISVQPSERAQSVMAEGGINGALNTMGEDDSPEQHAADTLKAGVFLADPEAVKGLTDHAPEILEWLVRIGAPLGRKDGRLILRNFGGQKKKRTAYAQSSTGKILMTALIDECRKYEAAGYVQRMNHHEFLSLILAEGTCIGVRVRDSYTGQISTPTGQTILACGGLNGFFPGMTTGTTINTGDAAAAIFSQGVEFANLEFIQYHPTTVQISEKRMLISEAARGEGGRLFVRRNGVPWYFMEEKYPELGNLMPRDVVSREIVYVTAQPDCENRVYLDLTGLSKTVWKEKLSDMREEILHYLAIDPAKDPVPVSPGIHYFMGGIHVDRHHRTNIRGLYAAGECACQYHGANRLGGNSTMGAIYGGCVAADTAADEVFPTPAEIQGYDGICPALAPSPRYVQQLCGILTGGLGILRDQSGLEHAIEQLKALSISDDPAEKNRRYLAEAMLIAALERRESRGAHTRTDYPDRDDEHFHMTSVLQLKEGQVHLRYEPIGEEFSYD